MPEEMDLDDILSNDDEEALVSFVADKMDYIGGPGYAEFHSMTPEDILCKACSARAIKCAFSLVNGETRLSVNLNSPSSFGMYPLHDAADGLCPCFTEFFLHHGARTDFLSISDDDIKYDGMLPINIALRRLGVVHNLPQWMPSHSIFKLLTKLYLPRTQNALETIGLLAWTTSATDKEFLYYASVNNLLAVAALLTVARGKLTEAVAHVRDFYSQNEFMIYEHKRASVLPLLQVLDVYERAGDAIEAYVKKEKPDTTRDQAIEEFTCLLNEAGFPLKRSDTDLTDLFWSGTYKRFSTRWDCTPQEPLEGNIPEGRPIPLDIGMPHYSKSGFRWTGYNDLSKARMSNKKPTAASMPKVPQESRIHTAVAGKPNVPQEFKTDPAVARTILSTGDPLRRCASLDDVEYRTHARWLPNFLPFLQKSPRGSLLLAVRGLLRS